MRKNWFKKTLAVTGIGLIMLTGAVSAATQNKAIINDKYVGTDKLRQVTSGTVGTQAKYATTKVTARSEGWIKEELYCDVMFVHKNPSTKKYVTVGRWMTETYGTIKSPYLTNSGVKEKTKLVTEAQAKKNPNSGATNTGITGYVLY